MLFSRAYGALLRRNWIYRKRNLIGSFLEFALPVGFICILLGIKIALQDSPTFSPVTVPAFFPTDQNAILPLSFRDYVSSLSINRTCLPLGDDFEVNNFFGNQNPFLKCNARSCQEAGQNAKCEYLILALAIQDDAQTTRPRERAQAFRDFLHRTYPELSPDNAPNNYLNYDFVRIFDTDTQLNDYVRSPTYGKTNMTAKVGFAIVFRDGANERDYAYTLRANSTNFNDAENQARPAAITSPPTQREFADFATLDNVCSPAAGAPDQGRFENSCTGQYLYNGAITMQRVLQDWIIEDTGARNNNAFVSEHGVSFVQFPTQSFTEDGFYAAIAPFAPLLIVLGLLYPVSAMIRSVSLEKQLRQKELMKMMSVVESDIGWSWHTSFFVFHIFTIIGSTIASNFLYEGSTPLILFVFWLLAFNAVIVFSLFLATFFSKATTATLIGILIFFAGYFLTFAADFQTGGGGVISLVSLHPVAAIAYGMQEIGRLEDAGVGATRNTLRTTDSPSGFTLVNSFGSLFFDAIFWGVLVWYLNRVIASNLGQPLPWYFPFTGQYWCPGRAKAPPSEGDDEEDAAIPEGIPFETVGEPLRSQISNGQGIDIRNLRKDFGEKAAVDGLSLSMYTGQVTALLGHNGAGKTTTISMLTGMLSPSDGHAVIAGKDIRSQMHKIRQEIGICLQHDCLFPQLTVQEHIEFFSRIKGLYKKYDSQEVAEKIKNSIEDVALYEKRNTQSKNLSGGMKRKLSVAIAFCGESKTVLLDEPTSGMDPFSRRFTWNVIRQYRQDRCIILTTHFLDEADILGDRIAIMADGQLCCAGSSLFLKKHYGVGYQLTVETQPSSDAVSRGSDAIQNIVTTAVPEASLLSNVGTELSFQLPLGSSSSFVPMFEDLDKEIANDNIVTYGVGVTTLDEVFLLVARGEEATATKSSRSVKKLEAPREGGGDGTVADRSHRSQLDLEKEGVFVRHVLSMWQKRALNFKRDKKAWLCSTFLPSLFVFVGFLLYRFASPTQDEQLLALSIDSYNPQVSTSPRNPVAFNGAGSTFSCQPGSCLVPFNNIVGPNGNFSFCGGSFLNSDSDTCTISESNEILSQLSNSGVDPIETFNENILESSMSLANTSDMYQASQYGAIHFTHDGSSIITDTNSSYAEEVIQRCEQYVEESSPSFFNASYCESYGGIGYIVSYNYTALHSAILFQSLADQAIIREANNADDFVISPSIFPLPLTDVENQFGEARDTTFAWFLIVLSFPLISGTFATFIVNEKSSKAKHLQTVAGVKPGAYWLSSYLWDVVNYQFPLWIIVILMFAFSVTSFTTSERGVVGGVIISMILFGPASAGFTYCMTFLFTSASLCNLVVIIFNFFIGMAGPLVVFILRIIGQTGDDNLVLAADVVQWVLRLIPSFNLGNALFKIVNIQSIEFLAREPIDVWHPDAILIEVIFQALWAFLYLPLAIMIDVQSTKPSVVSAWQKAIRFITCRCERDTSDPEEAVAEQATQALDDDVVAENCRIAEGEANDELIVLSELTKVYDNKKVAVNKLSLGIPHGQCFGLLGINGAGKTTTMSMLTAEFPPTLGDATLAGFSVTSQPEKIRQRIGYCPQFDAHFAGLTGREHVALYAAIKGVPNELVDEAVDAKLREVGLDEFDGNRLSANYSGGMKRKLSVACATIGQPQIVFLDEPSTGMDPVARRDMWKVISDMVSGGNVPREERTSVILTTHSMSECEALCPRIGIMAAGKLRCLGSAQHLKDKFGQGYQVEMKTLAVDKHDDDFRDVFVQLGKISGKLSDDDIESGVLAEVFLDITETLDCLKTFTNDETLSSKITAEDPTGYQVYKNATSGVGCTLEEIATFAVAEKRIQAVDQFFNDNFDACILRERQDTKTRYEVGSAGVKISTIFRKIEGAKEELRLADYGVSQTSLEQVFNMHAAEAEKLKHGANDG